MNKYIRNTKYNKNAMAYLILISFTVIILFIIDKDGYYYGSMTDWVSQHSVIPDYFRQKFYETGEIIPDFALNIGGGQNIYNFAYYGLLSPIILISYFLPFVPMAAYISVSSIIMIVVSVCLCYKWLYSNKFSRKVSIVASLCFICAGPVIFQFHRQVMFVDYFPFLFIGLMGVDYYFKTHKYWMVVIGIFLCIMTSYFFSVGCILTLVLYAIFVNFKRKPNCKVKELFQDMIPIVKGISIGILMSAVLWLPTIFVIISQRGGDVSISWQSLIIPTLPIKGLLFTSYNLGLTEISLIGLIWAMLRGKKNEKIISLILMLLLICPIFMYLLNGTIYLRPKALIPFLPLYVLVIAVFLKRLEKPTELYGKIKPSLQKIFFAGIICLVIFIASLNCIRTNEDEIWVKKTDVFNFNNPDKMALIEETFRKDNSFYRFNDLSFSSQNVNQTYGSRYNQTSIYTSTYNKAYNDFFYNIMHNPISTRNRVMCVSSENILFQNFMDVKYTVSMGNAPAGYSKVDNKGEYSLYQNNRTMPLGFAMGQTISREDFKKLSFPENMTTVLNRIITEKAKASDDGWETESAFQFKKIDLAPNLANASAKKNIVIRKDESVYHIYARANASITVPLDFNLKDTLLILRFTVPNREDQLTWDTSITINGMENKLANPTAPYPNENHNFVYVLSSNQKSKQLILNFSPGRYRIADVEAYVLPTKTIENATGKVDPLVVDNEKTKNNQIVGDIKVRKDGYFVMTIPYDKGFDITVDGTKQSYEKVDTAFVGFPISSGQHHIVIKYHVPYKRAGMALSLLGLIIFGYSCILKPRRKTLQNPSIGEERKKQT